MCRRLVSSSARRLWSPPACSCSGTRRASADPLLTLRSRRRRPNPATAVNENVWVPAFRGYERTGSRLGRHRPLAAPLSDDFRHLLDRHRPAEQIALRLGTAERREAALLLRRLDARSEE